MYPIRTSRPVWCQPFVKNHSCSEMCNTQYEITDNNIIRIVYQTGCLFPDKFEPVFIHISNHTSDIDYIDNKVNIPHTVECIIQYPMRNIFKHTHTFEPGDIKMSDILRVFDQYYRSIYQEEEEKATSKEYQIQKDCPNCDDEKYTEEYIHEHLSICESESEEEQCNICFESGSEIIKINRCQHVFHKECILKWFNTPKILNGEIEQKKSNTCPMCRQAIIYCSTCSSTGMIEEPFIGVVPPFDPEGEDDRPETDGPYHIHSLYYEELYFKGIMYDRIGNRLILLPFERIEDPEPENV